MLTTRQMFAQTGLAPEHADVAVQVCEQRTIDPSSLLELLKQIIAVAPQALALVMQLIALFKTPVPPKT